jgi:NADH-quinone oxidoreductase subunit L
MYFLVFHGKARFGQAQGHDGHGHDDPGAHHGLAPGQVPRESPFVVTLPLVLLAIPSVLIGLFTIEPLLFGNGFGEAIFVGDNHDALGKMAASFHGWAEMALHGLTGAPFWLAFLGVAAAWTLYMAKPHWPAALRRGFGAINTVLENKYYFDRFNEIVLAGGARLLGGELWRRGDQGLIDGIGVAGSSRLVAFAARMMSFFQTGHLYQYAFTMIAGVFILLTFWIVRGG